MTQLTAAEACQQYFETMPPTGPRLSRRDHFLCWLWLEGYRIVRHPDEVELADCDLARASFARPGPDTGFHEITGN